MSQQQVSRPCSEPFCEKPRRARGYCDAHYRRHRRTGKLALISETLEDRLWKRVRKTPGCWIWGGVPSGCGYGYLRYKGVSFRVHRISFELAYGKIPPGQMIDHKCRNRLCVRPDHLQAVDRIRNSENRSFEGHGTSGARNVCWDKQHKKWRVQVRHNWKLYDGGRFERMEDAIEAAKALRMQLHTNNLVDRRG